MFLYPSDTGLSREFCRAKEIFEAPSAETIVLPSSRQRPCLKGNHPLFPALEIRVCGFQASYPRSKPQRRFLSSSTR